MKEINLSKKKKTVVDDEDFLFVIAHKWYAHKSQNRYYARAEINGKKVYLHRFIMCISDPKVKVDHEDGDSLNNMRVNLRVATNRQNTRNHVELFSTNTSGYRGIVFHKNSKRIKRWQAKVWIEKDGISVAKSLGYFATPEEAARAFDEAAKEIYGEFCGKLNYE
jgi:hypothetical protein